MKKAMSVIVPVLLVGFVLFNRFHTKSTTSEAAKFEAMTLIERVSGYDESPQIFKSLVDKSHEQAFGEAYNMGGRRSRSTFDEERYFSRLGQLMAQRAMIAKRDEIAASISREWMIETRPVASAR